MIARAKKKKKMDSSVLKIDAERELTSMLKSSKYYAKREAIHKLSRHNTRLVRAMASRYTHRNVLFDDLNSAGRIALLKMMKRFNYKRKTKFSTYATWWIRQGVTRCIADTCSLVRYPVHRREKIYKVSKVKRQARHQLGRTPTNVEILTLYNLLYPHKKSTLEDIDTILQLIKREKIVDLDRNIYPDSSTTFADTLKVETELSTKSSVEQELIGNKLDEKLLDLLRWDENIIYRMIYGIPPINDHNLLTILEKSTIIPYEKRENEASEKFRDKIEKFYKELLLEIKRIRKEKNIRSKKLLIEEIFFFMKDDKIREKLELLLSSHKAAFLGSFFTLSPDYIKKLENEAKDKILADKEVIQLIKEVAYVKKNI